MKVSGVGIAFSTAVFAVAGLQLGACAPSNPNELVLKCEGTRVNTYLNGWMEPEKTDVALVLKFHLLEFALPPSETREPIEVVQEIRGDSLLNRAGSPSEMAQQGTLVGSDRELTLSASQNFMNSVSGKLENSSYDFSISRLTGDYAASYNFERVRRTENGHCEPFDMGTRKF
ncbi:MAG: hypothetical protein ABL956_06845 [Hyphomonadaceae bacterium]